MKRVIWFCSKVSMRMNKKRSATKYYLWLCQVDLISFLCDFFFLLTLQLRIYYLYNQGGEVRLTSHIPLNTVLLTLLLRLNWLLLPASKTFINSFILFIQNMLTDSSCVPSIVLGPENIAIKKTNHNKINVTISPWNLHCWQKQAKSSKQKKIKINIK